MLQTHDHSMTPLSLIRLRACVHKNTLLNDDNNNKRTCTYYCTKMSKLIMTVTTESRFKKGIATPFSLVYDITAIIILFCSMVILYTIMCASDQLPMESVGA